jgi:hypothetical protein
MDLEAQLVKVYNILGLSLNYIGDNPEKPDIPKLIYTLLLLNFQLGRTFRYSVHKYEEDDVCYEYAEKVNKGLSLFKTQPIFCLMFQLGMLTASPPSRTTIINIVETFKVPTLKSYINKEDPNILQNFENIENPLAILRATSILSHYFNNIGIAEGPQLYESLFMKFAKLDLLYYVSDETDYNCSTTKIDEMMDYNYQVINVNYTNSDYATICSDFSSSKITIPLFLHLFKFTTTISFNGIEKPHILSTPLVQELFQFDPQSNYFNNFLKSEDLFGELPSFNEPVSIEEESSTDPQSDDVQNPTPTAPAEGETREPANPETIRPGPASSASIANAQRIGTDPNSDNTDTSTQPPTVPDVDAISGATLDLESEESG